MEIYKISMDESQAFNTLINIEPFNSLSFDKVRLNELGIDNDNL
jgi:hypothetical protein